jgi:hypothetical protein
MLTATSLQYIDRRSILPKKDAVDCPAAAVKTGKQASDEYNYYER